MSQQPVSSASEFLKITPNLVGSRAKVVEAIHTQPYGMREFVVQDPDGYLITLAAEQR